MKKIIIGLVLGLTVAACQDRWPYTFVPVPSGGGAPWDGGGGGGGGGGSGGQGGAVGGADAGQGGAGGSGGAGGAGGLVIVLDGGKGRY